MNKTDTPAKVASNDQLGMYPERDHIAQGQYYIRHVDAMTREGLHSKSRIAGELAARDIEIDRLRAGIRELVAASGAPTCGPNLNSTTAPSYNSRVVLASR